MKNTKQLTSDQIKKLTFENKQRTLVFAQRGINPTERHLLNDIRLLMPHSKKENKFHQKNDLTEVGSLCEMRSCQNCLFFRKEGRDLFWYVAKTENGPTLKFRVTNSKLIYIYIK